MYLAVVRAIILAGGLGTRLAEETDHQPKPMVAVGRHPIIWHIMKSYSGFGIRDFTIAAGYRSDVIKSWVLGLRSTAGSFSFDVTSGALERIGDEAPEDWRVTVLETGEFSQTAKRLRLAMETCPGERVLMTYGDGLADVDIGDLIDFHESHGRLATVTAVRPPARFGRLSVQEGVVEVFGEKVDEFEDFVNGGFFVFEPGVLEYLTADEPLERGPMERLVVDGQLMAFEHRGFWQPMDTLRERRMLDELWKSGAAPWTRWWT